MISDVLVACLMWLTLAIVTLGLLNLAKRWYQR
jgi:hypothetical protein